MPPIPITFHHHAPPPSAHPSQIIHLYPPRPATSSRSRSSTSLGTHQGKAGALKRKRRSGDADINMDDMGVEGAQREGGEGGQGVVGGGAKRVTRAKKHTPTWISLTLDSQNSSPAPASGLVATASTSSESSAEDDAARGKGKGKGKVTPSQRRKGVARMSYPANYDSISTTAGLGGPSPASTMPVPSGSTQMPSTTTTSGPREQCLPQSATTAYLRPLNDSIIIRCLAPSASPVSATTSASQVHVLGHGQGHGQASRKGNANGNTSNTHAIHNHLSVPSNNAHSSSASSSTSHLNPNHASALGTRRPVHPYSRAADLGNDRSPYPSPREILRAEKAEEEKQKAKKESAVAARLAVLAKKKKGKGGNGGGGSNGGGNGNGGAGGAGGAGGGAGNGTGTGTGTGAGRASRAGTRNHSTAPTRSPSRDGANGGAGEAAQDAVDGLTTHTHNTRTGSADPSPNLSTLSTAALPPHGHPGASFAGATIGLGAPRVSMKRTRSSGLINVSTNSAALASVPAPGVSSPLRAVMGPMQAPKGSFGGETPPAREGQTGLADDSEEKGQGEEQDGASGSGSAKRLKIGKSSSKSSSRSPPVRHDQLAEGSELGQKSSTVKSRKSSTSPSRAMPDANTISSVGMDRDRARSAGAGPSSSQTIAASHISSAQLRDKVLQSVTVSSTDMRRTSSASATGSRAGGSGGAGGAGGVRRYSNTSATSEGMTGMANRTRREVVLPRNLRDYDMRATPA